MAESKLQSKDLEDFVMLATQGHGMRFLSNLLDYCGIHTSSFNPDLGAMSFKEGRRDVGLWVLALIKTIENGQLLLNEAEKYRMQLFEEDKKNGKAEKGK